MMTGTHLRKHGLTTAQYTERFPDAPMACDEARAAIREFHTGTVQTSEHVAKRIAGNRDRQTEIVAANFGYRLVRLVRLRECEFSKARFVEVVQ